ncbi:MAG TPA: thiamine pyrophosphate-dependent enzyme, partial [Streptosporangiaceae bacterium]|nr:thiamine pyrophosphate-dependent enzyme [Streptosporangiaceae bacterium]
ARQTAAPSLAHKGVGYGIPGEQVDGNDLAALLAVLGTAVERARGGAGPQLVEAHTYRVQAHTNADDPTRYRDEAEVGAWVARDPLRRLGTFLENRALLTAEQAAALDKDADDVAAAMRAGLSKDAEPDPARLFAHVYQTPTPQLAEQAALVADEISRMVDG